MKKSDTSLVELLFQLKQLLMLIQTLDKMANEEEISSSLKACSEKIEMLDISLKQNSDYSYEFYEEVARLVSVISSFRIDSIWEGFLQELNVWPLLNAIVNQIAEAVYQTDSLSTDLMGKVINWEKIPILKLQDNILLMEQAAERTRKEADDAVIAAEKFLDILPGKMTDIKDSDTFLQGSMEVIKVMYIKNAKAAIATDRSIAVKQFFLYKARQL